MTEIVLSVGEDGTLRFLYADRMRELLEEGEAAIRRASHVEPEGIQWTADLSPVGGPILGPYPTREEALSEEVRWLNHHHL